MNINIIKIPTSICLLLLLFSVQGISQIVADPANGQMDVTDQAGINLNANFIAPSAIGTLKIPVYNLNQLVALPAGTCKFIITLGNNFILDPSFNLATTPLNNYFLWTPTIAQGKVQIRGNLTTGLPQDFNGMAEFKLQATTAKGTSIVEAEFFVTNHNASTPLKDEDPNNNNATLTYTITMQTVPVNFTSLLITKKQCGMQVNFTAENPVNVKRYEIELSKDGTRSFKLAELSVNNIPTYQYDFPLIESNTAPNIFVRIKSVDLDGSFGYSETKNVSGTCNHYKSA